jgi:carbon dioxide concentrating mechanism protein CcmN
LIVAVPAQASNAFTNGHIQGNVDLAAGVAIAPGVLLGAAPGCRLVISAGVCLGADVVVQARQGDLVLELGVSLGSGVLVVGHGSIGQHTCIGANSTIINPSLGASQVVAPGSLVGDPSQASATPGASPGPAASSAGYTGGNQFRGDQVGGAQIGSVGAMPSGSVYGAGQGFQNGSTLGGRTSNGYGSNSDGSKNPTSTDSFSNGSSLNGSSPSPNAQTGGGSSVYGKAQVNRLLATLFPHRQPLNGATPEDRP